MRCPHYQCTHWCPLPTSTHELPPSTHGARKPPSTHGAQVLPQQPQPRIPSAWHSPPGVVEADLLQQQRLRAGVPGVTRLSAVTGCQGAAGVPGGLGVLRGRQDLQHPPVLSAQEEHGLVPLWPRARVHLQLCQPAPSTPSHPPRTGPCMPFCSHSHTFALWSCTPVHQGFALACTGVLHTLAWDPCTHLQWGLAHCCTPSQQGPCTQVLHALI